MDLIHFHLNILANQIILHYYNDTRCLLIFSENKQIFNYQGPMSAVQINIFKDNFDPNIIFNYHGCKGVIIESENPSAVFGKFESFIRFGMERFNQRRFLLLSSKRQLDMFDMVELNYVADFLVVVPDEDQENFELLTHEYVGTGDRNIPNVLDKWMVGNQTFVHGSDLYPDKISNQQGREWRMATLQYEPYSVIGDSVSNYRGSELSTATHFGLQHNMTPVPVMGDEYLWGEVFPNWTGNGILGNVIMDNADAGFGSLYIWESIYHYLDLSKPVVRGGVTCLVPAPKLAAGWIIPLLSYTPQIWACIGLVYGGGTLVLSVFQYYHNRNFFMRKGCHRSDKSSRSFPQILGVTALKIARNFLVQAVGQNEMPVELSSRLVMILMFVFSLILVSTYTGGLSSVMTIPRYDHAIRSTDDLAASGLNWGGTHDAWITSIQDAEEPKYVTLVSRFLAVPEKVLRDYALGDQFAFAIERLPYNNFAIETYIQKDVIGNFRLMREDIYWGYSVMMLRKNSILLPHLDAFILRVSETGLIMKWQNTNSQAVQLYMDSEVQKAVNIYSKQLREHQLVTLKLGDVTGAFVILIIGLFISFVVFMYELFKSKNRK